MHAIQVKMARAALGLSVRGLAEAAGVSHDTIVRMEAGDNLKNKTISAIRSALENRGISFYGDETTQIGVTFHLD